MMILASDPKQCYNILNMNSTINISIQLRFLECLMFEKDRSTENIDNWNMIGCLGCVLGYTLMFGMFLWDSVKDSVYMNMFKLILWYMLTCLENIVAIDNE